MPTARFTISILTFTALKQAKACIASVMGSTKPVRLVLTANGNPDAAAYFTDLANSFTGIEVVVNRENLGFIEPNKIALSKCETEFMVVLNDDAVVQPDWLDKLVAPMDEDDAVAIVGQNNACCSLRDNFYGFKGPRYEYVEFSCAMLRVSAIRQIGLFSDYLEFANCEDSDCSLRAREAGWKIAKSDFSIQHEVGATRRNVRGLAEIFQRNLAACQHRWADYLKSKDRKFPCER